MAAQTFGDGAGAAGHIQEFTFEGEPVWDYRFASTMQLAHHDIFKMPNGNVLMIVWDKKSPEQAVAAGRRPETVGQSQLLVDCIYEIHPTGKIGYVASASPNQKPAPVRAGTNKGEI